MQGSQHLVVSRLVALRGEVGSTWVEAIFLRDLPPHSLPVNV